MKVETTPLEGLLILHPRVFCDERGFFLESYNAATFEQLGLRTDWCQDNHAASTRGVLRGLHFQLGSGQAKLVRCTAGRTWDVAVDIRSGSSTFGRWCGVELTAENFRQLLIPEGFAHGYCVLSERAEMQYKCSTVYDPELESEIRWNDPQLRVEWPITDPVLSQRDIHAQSLRQYVKKIEQEQLLGGRGASGESTPRPPQGGS